MFDISWSELLLIAVVALVFIGPKELPGVLRTIGQYTGKIRRMASEFQDQFREAIREAEVADLKKDIDEATSHLNADPFAGVNTSTEWKHSEQSASPVPAADAPPAPPAEAVTPVAAEAHPGEPAAPAAAEPAPATTAEPAAAEAGTTSVPKPPASGEQAA